MTGGQSHPRRPCSTLGIVPGRLDELPLIPADMHPPVDPPRDLERFNARLATYLAEEIARVGGACVLPTWPIGVNCAFGAPYISHPLLETLLVGTSDARPESAALLHDVTEDTTVTKAQIAERFGKGRDGRARDGVSVDRV